MTDRVYTNPEGLKKLNNMEFKIKTERVADQFKTTQVLKHRSERNNKIVNRSVNQFKFSNPPYKNGVVEKALE